MRIWNGYRFTEYSGEPEPEAYAGEKHEPPVYASLEHLAAPVQAPTADEISKAEASKVAGALPVPTATFTFDTSDVDACECGRQRPCPFCPDPDHEED